MNLTPDIILYVDDEEQALKYFRLTFAKEYQVLTASSAAEAWTLLKLEGERIAVVISDQRMPGKAGVELLEDIKECYPRILRLLTTAYADLSSAIAAVNRGAVYAYINKPWNPEEVHMILRRALEFLNLQRERDRLLVEKLSVYHQLLFIDRLRSLGLLASVCAGRIRRPLTGASAFWRDHCAHFSEAADSSKQTPDLWAEMIALTRKLVDHGRRLDAWLNRHGPGSADGMIDAATLASLMTSALPALHLVPAASSTRPTPTLRAAETSSATVSERPLVPGLESLCRWLLELVGGDSGKAVAQLTITPDASALDLTLAIEGTGRSQPVADDTDLAGFYSYLAIYHYGGAITVNSWSQTGGSLRMTIPSSQKPVADDTGMEDFLNALATMEPLPYRK